MNAPNNCPICGEKENWKLIDTTKKGFNAKNAVIVTQNLGVNLLLAVKSKANLFIFSTAMKLI